MQWAQDTQAPLVKGGWALRSCDGGIPVDHQRVRQTGIPPPPPFNKGDFYRYPLGLCILQQAQDTQAPLVKGGWALRSCDGGILVDHQRVRQTGIPPPPDGGPHSSWVNVFLFLPGLRPFVAALPTARPPAGRAGCVVPALRVTAGASPRPTAGQQTLQSFFDKLRSAWREAMRTSVCRETRLHVMRPPGFQGILGKTAEKTSKEKTPSISNWPSFSDSWQQT